MFIHRIGSFLIGCYPLIHWLSSIILLKFNIVGNTGKIFFIFFVEDFCEWPIPIGSFPAHSSRWSFSDLCWMRRKWWRVRLRVTLWWPCGFPRSFTGPSRGLRSSGTSPTSTRCSSSSRWLLGRTRARSTSSWPGRFAPASQTRCVTFW